MKSLEYRKDIDGLRAIAVISVVLFHLKIEQLAGGFIGVDIFFVISGFLITSIIANKHHNKNFTFKGFYLGRVRRIIPPLVATVVLTFIASAFILTPDDFIRFSRSAIGALTSTSNILFFIEAGYWDTSSELKPLLHTWSLGVEEQFYLFWPALVIGTLTVFGRQHFTAVLAIITVVSLVGSLIISAYNISAAFYLFPARIFQFAAGATIAQFAVSNHLNQVSLQGWIKDLISGCGLATLIVCVLLFDEHTRFPGWAVIAPTLGTMAILLTGSFKTGQGPLCRAILCNPASIWFGLVSYALYLVHWPIVSLYRYQTDLNLDTLEQVILAVAMILAAAALHYGLERRFYARASSKKNNQRLNPVAFASRTGLASLLVGVVAAHAAFTDGWAWRTPDLKLSPQVIEQGMRHRFSKLASACRIQNFFTDQERCNRSDTVKILFLGNSHEPDGFNFIRAGYEDDPNLEFINFGTVNRCQDLEISENGSWVSSAQDCQNRLDVLNSEAFVNQLDFIVYAANVPFAANKRPLVEMITSMRTVNQRIKLITFGGYINTNIPCARIFNETGSTDGCASPEYVRYFANTPENGPLYEQVMALTSTFIDRVDLLCENRELEKCLTRTRDGVPLFYDSHHLSLEFAEMAGRMYAAQNPNLFAQELAN